MYICWDLREGIKMNQTPKQRIFLIGMPGVGKSYWGTRVALRHGWHFTDMDVYLAKREGLSIPEIFEQLGESGFRKAERRCLAEIISLPPGDEVIACGGGTPCFYNNMEVMKNAGTVVYLQAQPGFLYANIRKDKSRRPLLEGKAPLMVQLEQMLQHRKYCYEQAHHILQAQDISLATFDKILRDV
jgi:shikimate kinase